MPSANDQPPWFGPTTPDYPELFQEVRVYGAPITGTTYACFTQQFIPPLSLRDREAALCQEPNGIPLNPGYYVARLVGSYLGLPLYMTFCCGVMSSSSSSGSSSSGMACTVCSGPTAGSWSVPASGFTGDYTIFNNNWNVNVGPSVVDGACSWFDDTFTVMVGITDSLIVLQFKPPAGSPVAIYYGMGWDRNCCTTQTLTLSTGDPFSCPPEITIAGIC